MTHHGHLLVLVQLLALTVISHISAFPTPTAPAEDKTVSIRELTEEKPLQEQIAEADSVKAAIQAAESSRTAAAKDAAPQQDSDDLTVLKSLADSQKSKQTVKPTEEKDQYISDESDSTKTRRLADDYDSTKNGVTSDRYPDEPESFHQVDGTPLTAEDIVQRIANKIYQEDDRGVFDRIISKLLKLGLISESQADTLEYQVAEALQDLITKNARKNEIDDEKDEDQETRGDEEEQDSDDNLDPWELPKRPYNDEEDNEAEEEDDEREDEADRDAEDDGTDGSDNRWDRESEDANEVNPDDEMQDLQYFPNFYRLLKSLDSAQDTQEKETLITIMKTLIDFVKMMVKYGTITPEEGVSYLENLDTVIAIQTKNKLGKSLDPGLTGPHGKILDEDDNTKAEAAKMQKEFDIVKDSTKVEQPTVDTNQAGKSEVYLEAIRKNIEWLKKQSRVEGREDYDLSKLKDFMNQQVDSYIQKGIIAKNEGDTIKRIYGSL